MKPLVITVSQWSVLAWLSRGGNEGVMQVDIARHLEVGKVTIGGLIDRLEASGYVERRADATDPRVRRVFITAKGFETIHSTVCVGAENYRNILAVISQDNVTVTDATLTKSQAHTHAQNTGDSLRPKK